ncbi:MAG: 1-acyl-sn-glycerol-3-phosphate acyltransferase, partial [Euzebyales bacterium]|nr:1-acyl-sn-glycerol-3-phosphate acyltransferase [Euzebyales bacterium]
MHVTVPNWVSVAFVALAKVFLWWAVPTAVEGRLPAGGCVLVSNHANYADGPLAMTLDWHRVRPVAKPNPDLIVKIGFALTRTIVTGREVLGRAIGHLRAGGVVWVAPEGRLNTGPALLPGHRSAARIAA